MWLINEIHHRVSKEASNSFFEIAKKWFHRLFQAKEREGVNSKIPQFVHLRRKLYDSKVPPIKLEMAFQHITTKEIHFLEDIETAPVSQFPRDEYSKLYEIASVKVK